MFKFVSCKVLATAARFTEDRSGREVAAGVEAQSSAMLLRKAGLFGVLDAAKQFREACTEGVLKVFPREAYDLEKHDWLLGLSEPCVQK